MSRPRLLDLCSGAGLGAIGYDRAGWDVVGVDINPQPNYPFEFHQGDAIQFAKDHAHEFDALHASWPCQAANPLTTGTNKGKFEYPQLIPEGREVMEASGLPWVIENTAGAPIRKDLLLCGDMFRHLEDGEWVYELAVIRHRYFEFGGGFTTAQPEHPTSFTKHRGRVAGLRHGEWFTGPYCAVYGDGGGKGSVADWQRAMGITHTDVRKEIAEGIPPAYGQWVGERLMTHLLATQDEAA